MPGDRAAEHKHRLRRKRKRRLLRIFRVVDLREQIEPMPCNSGLEPLDGFFGAVIGGNRDHPFKRHGVRSSVYKLVLSQPAGSANMKSVHEDRGRKAEMRPVAERAVAHEGERRGASGLRSTFVRLMLV